MPEALPSSTLTGFKQGLSIDESSLLAAVQELWQVANQLQQLVAGDAESHAPSHGSIDWVDVVYGNWSCQAQAARKRLQVATAQHRVTETGRGNAVLALVSALRGEPEKARSYAEQSAFLAPADHPSWIGRRLAIGITDLAAGQALRAYRSLRNVLCEQDAKNDTSHLVVLSWLAEAAVRTNRVEEARELIDPFVTQLAATATGYLAFDARLSIALLADEDRRIDQMMSLRAVCEDKPGYLVAREEFALAQFLRRARRISESRPLFERAAYRFTKLGAESAAELARTELAATAKTRLTGDARWGLTARQREIAELAADGLSNREIGERLFISARTVGYHLFNLFPKLNVTSRAQLARRLEAIDGTEDVRVTQTVQQ